MNFIYTCDEFDTDDSYESLTNLAYMNNVRVFHFEREMDIFHLLFFGIDCKHRTEALSRSLSLSLSDEY